MSENTMCGSQDNPYRATFRLRYLLLCSLIWVAPTLACGSFAPRPTPTPTLAALPIPDTGQSGVDEPVVESADTPIPEAPTATPMPVATATFTATPEPGTALAPGQPARISAPAGLNFRDTPTTSGGLLGQFGTGQVVTVLDGPVSADNFVWWQIQDEQGNIGWVAEGDGETVWLTPRVGESQPVNRPPQVGDRVVVTIDTQLSIRSLPGTNAPLLTRANPGTEFTVLAGPQQANGFSWFQIRSDAGDIQGWAADSDGTSRWLSPLE